ncbi:MAG TPA: hypothetical protein VJP77_06925, partial [Planctomycetota bacterium]|nr:hypothetical protein [Planctomycetota bacterium]
AVPGLLAMIPGAYAPYAEAVRVPVFVAVGDHDLHGAHAAAAALPAAPEVVAFTQEDCWHCHFVARSRARLFERVAHFVDCAVARSG